MKDKEVKELKEIEHQLEMINKQIGDAIENYPKLIELAEKLRQVEDVNKPFLKWFDRLPVVFFGSVLIAILIIVLFG